MKIKKATSTIIFEIITYVLLALGAIVCVFPFIIILSGSFTDNTTILTQGYSILPRDVTLSAYQTIFRAPKDILQAYKMTFYYTSIFGGGMIPWYLMYANVLNMKGSTFAIWFPALMSPFLVILMRTFIVGSVPDAITESAKIDGAGHFTIFMKIVMPVLGPGLATVGLFLALGYWNDWYRSSMFSTNSETWELQFYLYDLLNATTAFKQMSQSTSISTAQLSTESVKLAMAVVATGPVLLFYPFVQKYFVSGITVGAVKG